MSYTPRLKKDYKERVISELKKEFSYKSVMQVPKILKIVVSKGVGAAVADKKLVEHAIDELTLITGQKASPTLAKKGNAKLGIRKNTVTGAKVTLRGEIMYNFLDLLSTIVLPRIKNFDGLNKKSLNNEGNFTFQINDPFVFPQLEAASEVFNHLGPITITITTTTQKKDQNLNLLRGLNLPLK